MKPKYFIFFVCVYIKWLILDTKQGISLEFFKNENDNANKIRLLLLCISDKSKTLGRTNIYDLIDKKIKGKQGAKK